MDKYKKSLTPSDHICEKHRNDLKKSGLTDKTIDALGFTTSLAGDSWLEKISDLKNKTVFGYRGRYDSDAIAENRYQSKEGETPKYRSTPEVGIRFFLPHIEEKSWVRIASDPSISIFITEGGKKATLLTQEGYFCIGLTGVWNFFKKPKFKDKKAEEEYEKLSDVEKIRRVIPSPSFEDFIWKKRRVYIVFDSDKYDNFQVLLAEHLLWLMLKERFNADPWIINLPKDYEAKGIDDYFVKHGGINI